MGFIWGILLLIFILNIRSIWVWSGNIKCLREGFLLLYVKVIFIGNIRNGILNRYFFFYDVIFFKKYNL